jgi:hypothetical protein
MQVLIGEAHDAHHHRICEVAHREAMGMRSRPGGAYGW